MKLKEIFLENTDDDELNADFEKKSAVVDSLMLIIKKFNLKTQIGIETDAHGFHYFDFINDETGALELVNGADKRAFFSSSANEQLTLSLLRTPDSDEIRNFKRDSEKQFAHSFNLFCFSRPVPACLRIHLGDIMQFEDQKKIKQLIGLLIFITKHLS